jgi:hypothetical protein
MAVFQSFFPFNHEYSSWENYNGNLIIYYAAEGIPYTDEENWRLTAKNVTQIAKFAGYIVPDPDLFQYWQDWAKEFTLIVNGKPNQ